jgi:hypothetical protein
LTYPILQSLRDSQSIPTCVLFGTTAQAVDAACVVPEKW